MSSAEGLVCERGATSKWCAERCGQADEEEDWRSGSCRSRVEVTTRWASISKPLTIRICSPVPRSQCYKHVGQKQAEHMIQHQARGRCHLSIG